MVSGAEHARLRFAYDRGSGSADLADFPDRLRPSLILPLIHLRGSDRYVRFREIVRVVKMSRMTWEEEIAQFQEGETWTEFF